MHEVRRQDAKQVRECSDYYTIHPQKPALTVRLPNYGGPPTPKQRLKMAIRASGRSKKGLLL